MTAIFKIIGLYAWAVTATLIIFVPVGVWLMFFTEATRTTILADCTEFLK